MNFIFSPTCFFFIALFLAGCEDMRVQTENDVREIEEMSAARADAFNRGDAASIASYFVEEGVLMAPGAPAQFGRDAVETYYQNIFDQFETKLNSHYEEVTVSGDLAFGRGIAEVELTPHDDGETMYSTSKYINILARQSDGSWLTTHDIWNDNE